MFLRAAPFFAMLITLLLLAACEASPPSSTPPHTPTTAPEYLAEEIPPCTPAVGSLVDPCEPDLLWSDSAGIYGIGSEPRGLRLFLGDGSYGWASLTHLVVRGTFLHGAVRCTSEGDLFRPPSYLDVSWFLQSNTKSIKCYADVRVNSYVLGSGSSTLTVMLKKYRYWYSWEQEVVDEWIGYMERLLIEGGDGSDFRVLVPQGGYEGREMILFVGPAVDASTEVLQVFHTWDVERREDGTAIAVHPFRGHWSSSDTYRSRLEMEMPVFTQAVAAANQERIDEYGGRTAADDGYPMLVTDSNHLSQFLTDISAYSHPDGPPAPPCGLAMPDQIDNPGLMLHCLALLVAMDTLRGTATLNWSVDTAITGCDGVTTSGTPSRVTELDLSGESLSGSIPAELGKLLELTHLDLSSNSLTGEIPRELGELSNLTELRLSGNSLTGCIPLALKG